MSSNRPSRLRRVTERVKEALSPYQALARFARDRCDSEQEIESSRVTESWLVDRVLDFLNARRHRYLYRLNAFSPVELQSGGPGGPRRIDLIGQTPTADKHTGHAALLLEAKLMMNDGHGWANAILADVFRLAATRDRTSKYTHRLVMVVGQERWWRLVEKQCDGLLPHLCPFERRLNRLTFGLTWYRRSTRLTDKWKQDYAQHIEDYLTGLLPRRVGIELVGLSKSNRDADDKPELGMTARIWRVFPA